MVHAATTDEKILATLSDDDLAGVIAAVRRIGSFAAWAELTAIREYATRPDTRRPAPAPDAAPGPAPGAPPVRPPVPAAAVVPAGWIAVIPTRRSRACPATRRSASSPPMRSPRTCTLTWQAAADQITYACHVAARLPVTFAALRAGKIHPVHLRIAEDETAYLDEKFLAEADEKLAAAAQSKTFGQFRSYAHRVILKLDPDSALRRKNEARKDAHVRPFREASGNAGMSARELPPTRSWRPGSTSTSGPATCAPPGSPAPSKNSASRPTWTCCKNATSASPRPAPPQAPTPPAPMAPAVSATPTTPATSTTRRPRRDRRPRRQRRPRRDAATSATGGRER